MVLMPLRTPSDTEKGRSRWAYPEKAPEEIRFPKWGRVTPHGVAHTNLAEYIVNRQAYRASDQFIVEPIPVRLIGRDNVDLVHVPGDVCTEPSAVAIRTATESSAVDLGTIDADTGAISLAQASIDGKLTT
ncbi:unnamed protein product, partial [marine sediment metagenome]